VTSIKKHVKGVFGQNLCALGFRVDSQEEIKKILWESAKQDNSGVLSKLFYGVSKTLAKLCVCVDYVNAVNIMDKLLMENTLNVQFEFQILITVPLSLI